MCSILAHQWVKSVKLWVVSLYPVLYFTFILEMF